MSAAANLIYTAHGQGPPAPPPLPNLGTLFHHKPARARFPGGLCCRALAPLLYSLRAHENEDVSISRTPTLFQKLRSTGRHWRGREPRGSTAGRYADAWKVFQHERVMETCTSPVCTGTSRPRTPASLSARQVGSSAIIRMFRRGRCSLSVSPARLQ